MSDEVQLDRTRGLTEEEEVPAQLAKRADIELVSSLLTRGSVFDSFVCLKKQLGGWRDPRKHNWTHHIVVWIFFFFFHFL